MAKQAKVPEKKIVVTVPVKVNRKPYPDYDERIEMANR
jgi:hypothetical protein